MNNEKISKKLSYFLRHSQDPLYIDLDGGWASVNVILEALRKRYPDVSRTVLDKIVSRDNKGRYTYDKTGTKIRANQGHSIPDVIVEMEQPAPPEFLYHGTSTRFLDNILRDGLKSMNRQWVHISPDYDTAISVGKRHGNPVVLLIRARDFVADGYELYCSTNGVWQAKTVPVEYISVLED